MPTTKKTRCLGSKRGFATRKLPFTQRGLQPLLLTAARAIGF
ncbi:MULTISPECIES: hypothetical protein [Microcoleaceae]|nr:hypothetical protein [Tychonema sp. LEGE 06208]